MKKLLFLFLLLPVEVDAQNLKIGDTITALKASDPAGYYENIYFLEDKSKVQATEDIDGAQMVITEIKQAKVGKAWHIYAEMEGRKMFVRLPHALDDEEIKLDGFITDGVVFTVDNKPFHVKKGDTLNMGTGSMPDGDFKFIRINSSSLFSYHSNNGYQGLANQANSLPRRFSGLKFKIIRIDRRGTRRLGYVHYPIISLGLTRYEVDYVNALRAGEIIVEGYEPGSTNPKIILQQNSIADEIKKLSDLKEQGIITEEEFDAQKTKLLAK